MLRADEMRAREFQGRGTAPHIRRRGDICLGQAVRLWVLEYNGRIITDGRWDPMYKNALLIYNGNAGQAEMGQQLAVLTEILAPAVEELTLLQTKEQGDAERYCRERGESYELLLVLGGDGTVHECVNGLADLERPPLVGILPGGTCNDFSRALHIPQQLDEAARVLLGNKRQQVDIGAANGRYFSNFFGIGLITDTSENINSELKGKFGKLSYFLSTLQKVRQAESFAFKLESGQGELEGEAVMILVANGRFLGTNALPGTDKSLADGLLDVYIIYEAGLPLLIELLTHKASHEWDPQNSAIGYLQTSTLSINTAQPMRADTDGEIYMETPAAISVVPRKLTFLAGEAKL
ncbi:diacylglycerol/lipid kinase family protein [Paenibacillus abyssi]|uniref:diacylglycerol/lipid kinase family protein n=1 Tax=Paenibacillus abyssi TaxID=1340531 RepID=UPI0027E53D0C|nr:diacylglycerol kinase family lipid kinase [Paenibacillus abyssi]